MSNQFGPWATLIDAGGNPQLSSFWRRRLTMLVPTSQTSSVLSRGNLLWLVAAGLLMLVLPTFRVAPVVADDAKPANAATPSQEAKRPTQAPAPKLWRPSEGDPYAENPYVLLPAYDALGDKSVRKALNLSREQEQKLREINACFRPQWEKWGDAHAPQRTADERDSAQVKFRQEASRVRDQIEQLLTAKQLTEIRQIVLGQEAHLLPQQSQMREKLGLNSQQEKDLEQLVGEEGEKTWRFEREIVEKMAGVLSPQQRKKVYALAGLITGAAIVGSPEHPVFTPYVQLERPAVQKELGLNDQQRNKLTAIWAKYSPLAFKLLPELQKEAADHMPGPLKATPAQKKWHDLETQTRQELDAVLTPPQLATLKKISADQLLAAIPDIPHILKEIDASPKQQEELRRLRDERFKMSALKPSLRETQAKALAVLTPPQREAFEREVARQHHWLVPAAYMSSSDYGNLYVGTVTVAGDEKKPADKPENVSPSSGPAAGDKPAASYSGAISIATTTVSSESLYIPGYSYMLLDSQDGRKELNITADQEKKLWEISRKHLKWLREAGAKMRKEAENLSPEERAAKQSEFQARRSQDDRNVRKEVNELLTPAQLTAIRSISIGMLGAGRLMYDPQFRETIGVSQQQIDALRRRLVEDETAKGKQRQLGNPLAENTKKLLAVITPKQWERAERIVGDYAGHDYPGPEFQVLHDPDVLKQLAISAEQQKQLDAIFAEVQARSPEMAKLVDDINGPLPAKQREAKAVELHRKIREMEARNRRQVEDVLTQEQRERFSRLAAERALLDNLLMSGFFGYTNGDETPPGILDRIGVSKEQKQQLRRLHSQEDRIMRQHYREVGETVLKILTPEQQQKLIEAELSFPQSAGSSSDRPDKSQPAKKTTPGGSPAAAGDGPSPTGRRQ